MLLAGGGGDGNEGLAGIRLHLIWEEKSVFETADRVHYKKYHYV